MPSIRPAAKERHQLPGRRHGIPCQRQLLLVVRNTSGNLTDRTAH
ncbi:MAG: hypothetical protein ACLT8E_06115 [Akkermansia sp.]